MPGKDFLLERVGGTYSIVFQSFAMVCPNHVKLEEKQVISRIHVIQSTEENKEKLGSDTSITLMTPFA